MGAHALRSFHPKGVLRKAWLTGRGGRLFVGSLLQGSFLSVLGRGEGGECGRKIIDFGGADGSKMSGACEGGGVMGWCEVVLGRGGWRGGGGGGRAGEGDGGQVQRDEEVGGEEYRVSGWDWAYCVRAPFSVCFRH